MNKEIGKSGFRNENKNPTSHFARGQFPSYSPALIYRPLKYKRSGGNFAKRVITGHMHSSVLGRMRQSWMRAEVMKYLSNSREQNVDISFQSSVLGINTIPAYIRSGLMNGLGEMEVLEWRHVILMEKVGLAGTRGTGRAKSILCSWICR